MTTKVPEATTLADVVMYGSKSGGMLIPLSGLRQGLKRAGVHTALIHWSLRLRGSVETSGNRPFDLVDCDLIGDTDVPLTGTLSVPWFTPYSVPYIVQIVSDLTTRDSEPA